jgi:tRNA(fMet)-specific endonuclease VapC
VLPFDSAIGRGAAELRQALERRGEPIGPMDTLIAATALAHNATLVTRNVREFGRVPALKIVNWHD